MTMLAFAGAAVRFAQTTILEDLTFTISRGERWGIVGRNGAGKTSLFQLITGGITPAAGSVVRGGTLRIAVLDQHRTFNDSDSVWDGAAGAFKELRRLEQTLADDAAAMGEAGDAVTEELLERYGRDLERFEHEGGYTVTARVDAILHGLGFDPLKAREQTIGTLSGGERGRLGLAAELAKNSDLLLLDEPTNHLDLETTRWLEEYLRDAEATVLAISHDRAFLQNVCDHMLHLEGKTAIPYTGNYEDSVEQRALRRLSAERAFAKNAKSIAKEEDYIRRNIAGQNSFQAKGRRRRLERMPRLSPPPGEAGTMALRFDPRSRGGDQVLVAEGVKIELGGRTLLHDFSATIRRGDVIGLVGPNGAGKSTLLSVLLEEHPPTAGSARIGESIDVGYYRQDLSEVPRESTLFDTIHDTRPQWSRGQVQDHLGKFGFTGDSVKRRADSLSGGELARMALALLVLTGANFLVFDEPSNHLDVESIEALEDSIEGFGGTVLLVSHDRALLRTLTTRTWVLRDGVITDFPGGFEEWEQAEVDRAAMEKSEQLERNALERGRERARAKAAPSAPAGPKPLTAAKRKLEEAERRVHQIEARVAERTRALEAPELYGSPNGARRASELGRELEEVKLEMERALAAWEAASLDVERLS
ncbi:MAG: ABC-F family ATP-binding cassette domain-containing protein [Gemmatimonadota bacterium]